MSQIRLSGCRMIHSEWSSWRAGNHSTASAVIDPARLTTMPRAFEILARRWLIVTPPNPWSTIADGCPNTFSVKP